MRETLLGRPTFHDDVERFTKPCIGFRHGNAKTGEFIVAIAFADAEIEPAAGQKIDRGGLLGEQYRIVPRQHQDCGAEP